MKSRHFGNFQVTKKIIFVPTKMLVFFRQQKTALRRFLCGNCLPRNFDQIS
nr:MAG TPA: hypothetical protein [Caudoviricetes sp.]